MKRGNPWLLQVPNSIDPGEIIYCFQAPPIRRGLYFFLLRGQVSLPLSWSRKGTYFVPGNVFFNG